MKEIRIKALEDSKRAWRKPLNIELCYQVKSLSKNYTYNVTKELGAKIPV